MHTTWSRFCKEQEEKALKKETNLATRTGNDTHWTMDTGASDHLTVNKDLLNFYKKETNKIQTANGAEIISPGKGNIQFETTNDNGLIKNVLYCPSLTQNLLSAGKLADQGCTVIFNKTNCFVLENSKEIDQVLLQSKIILKGVRNGGRGLYYLYQDWV